MKGVFEALRDSLLAGEDAVLVSVIATSGSAPRGEGAKMAVLAKGEMGTVGGGAVEHACAVKAREMLRGGVSGTHHFTLQPGGAADLGMVCGGDVEVCFVVFSHQKPESLMLAEAALALYDRGRDAWLITWLRDGKAASGLYDAEHGLRFLDERMLPRIRPLLSSRSVLARDGDMLFVEPLVREGSVYIFGGGHVSQALVPVLGPLEFRTVVFEDRPEFVAGGILGDFADISASIALTERDYAVIMTRGHASDAVVLAQVLRTPAGYVGMMGSRKKLEATHDRLRAQGFSEDVFARIHSPIGIAIGGQTPAEIAISIAAELIAHRAKNA